MPTHRNPSSPPPLADLTCQGIWVRGADAAQPQATAHRVLEQLGLQDLAPHLRAQAGTDTAGAYVQLCLDPQQAATWAPGYDTLGLAHTLQLITTQREADLVREIVIAMLIGPVAFEFPSVDELISAVHIRRNLVHAAGKTTLNFRTTDAERPTDCWAYDEDRGFVVLPGVPLITALAKATQPEVSGALYSFSCYRASEYVILLAIAQELAVCNPALLAQLQTLWERRPIKSGEFHDVFLREQGSMQTPLPPHYFVPGDRTWFRNPDGVSAEASGFEGSWVMYLGGGLFNNFWIHDKPYTLAHKCVEVYHWRDGLYLDADGEERIDEVKIAPLIEATLNNPTELQRVLAIMQRYREPRGVYTDAGGCIDTTREFARWVCPGTSDLHLPTV
jgi:hypothetical protein